VDCALRSDRRAFLADRRWSQKFHSPLDIGDRDRSLEIPSSAEVESVLAVQGLSVEADFPAAKAAHDRQPLVRPSPILGLRYDKPAGHVITEN
jgi:hypothetical protein